MTENEVMNHIFFNLNTWISISSGIIFLVLIVHFLFIFLLFVVDKFDTIQIPHNSKMCRKSV